MCLRILIFTLFVIGALNVQAKNIAKTTVDARWRTSFEFMPIESDKDMGLIGLHYDIYPFKWCADCYMGIGGYSGATGEEGGFFTAGLTTGWTHKLSSNFKSDIGFHIGGGGGSDATYPGGGLIIRSHAGIQYVNNFGINLGVANIGFPNSTKVDKYDSHFYAGIVLPTSIWVDSLDLDLKNYNSGGEVGFRVSPAFLMYRPIQEPITKSGTYTSGNRNDDITLMGIQLSWHYGDVFYPLEMYGAAGGGVDGYATLFSGIGYQRDGIWSDSFLFESKILIGVGGDGRLDTGGGGLLQPMIGLRLRLTEQLSFAAFLGKTYGLDGPFESTNAEFSLSWSSKMPKSEGVGASLFDDSVFEFSRWNGALANKTYFTSSDILQTDGEQFASKLHLFGVQLEKPLNNYLSVVGNTYWAHTGNIGSYAEGGLGLKANLSIVKNIDVFAQTQLVVAGGGDVDVDNGFLVSGEVGVGINLIDEMFFDFSYGYTQSSQRNFKAEMLTIKLRWNTESIFK